MDVRVGNGEPLEDSDRLSTDDALRVTVALTDARCEAVGLDVLLRVPL